MAKPRETYFWHEKDGWHFGHLDRLEFGTTGPFKTYQLAHNYYVASLQFYRKDRVNG